MQKSGVKGGSERGRRCITMFEVWENDMLDVLCHVIDEVMVYGINEDTFDIILMVERGYPQNPTA